MPPAVTVRRLRIATPAAHANGNDAAAVGSAVERWGARSERSERSAGSHRAAALPTVVPSHRGCVTRGATKCTWTTRRCARCCESARPDRTPRRAGAPARAPALSQYGKYSRSSRRDESALDATACDSGTIAVLATIALVSPGPPARDVGAKG